MNRHNRQREVGLVAVLVWILWTGVALAHEVLPAIGDLTVEDGTVTLEIALNAEAIVAGVDLEGVDDTNDTLLSREVDALRALAPNDMADRIRRMAPEISNLIEFQADGRVVPLQLTRLEVDEVGDLALPRESRLTFQAFILRTTSQVSVYWPANYGTLVLRQQGVEEPYTGFLSGQSTGPISVDGGAARGSFATFWDYIPVGFGDILPNGLDHILFVLALLFLSPRFHPLLWQVAAFTFAHSITLTLAGLGLVSLPAWIVEPLIAASIIYVAVENLSGDRISSLRPVVVFVFGLLHGLGFAAKLADFGLPQGLYLPALVGFNVGVEVAQVAVLAAMYLLITPLLLVERSRLAQSVGIAIYLAATVTFIAMRFALDTNVFDAQVGMGPEVFFVPLATFAALCFAGCWRWSPSNPTYRRFVSAPASIGIALVGAYWLVERTLL